MMPFYPPSGSRTQIGELKEWVADQTNEHCATLLSNAKEIETRACLDVCVFTCFLMVGMVPPLSSFLSGE
jgi:hypothetical protein